MTGYKLKYGEYGHDCWGKAEWCGWFEYDNNVYTDKNKADQAKREAEMKHRDRNFELYEVNII